MMSRLKEVIDPEIGLNIVELGMVKGISVDSDRINVEIALTVKGCPLASTIEKDITRILGSIDGVTSVSVTMTNMSKDELNKLAIRLQEMKSTQRSPGKIPGLSSGTDKLDKKGIRTIISVMSGKGGVGKSYVTAMLAIELRRQGFEVGVLDADITGPSIAKIFGLSGKPMSDDKGIVPKTTRSGIKVISMNLLLDAPDTPVIWRGPIINGVIRQLYNDVHWGDLHFMLVDLPPGTGDAPLTVFQSLPVDGAVIVTTPQDLAMLIVKKAINMARQLNIPIAGLVENMSYMTCPHCSERIEMFEDSDIESVAAELKINYLGKLPFDPQINRLSDEGNIEKYSSDEVMRMALEVRNQLNKLVGMTTTPISWKNAS